jgi:hypothetical protein
MIPGLDIREDIGNTYPPQLPPRATVYPQVLLSCIIKQYDHPLWFESAALK